MNKADIKAPQLARARPFAAILSAETCDEFVRNEFEKIAIYGSKKWQETTAKIGGWFISGEIGRAHV